MKMINGKLRLTDNGYAAFVCPGCGDEHMIKINDGNTSHPCWTFNNDCNKPTFSPSVLVTSGHYSQHHKSDDCWCSYNKEHADELAPFTCYICHSFVIDGKIQFLTDCTHKLAGMTVDLPEYDKE